LEVGRGKGGRERKEKKEKVKKTQKKKTTPSTGQKIMKRGEQSHALKRLRGRKKKKKGGLRGIATLKRHMNQDVEEKEGRGRGPPLRRI